MKIIYNIKTGDICGIVNDENIAIDEGFMLTDVSDDFSDLDIAKAIVINGAIVSDMAERLNFEKSRRKSDIKSEAARLIEATDWKLARAREREAAGWATLADVDAVLAEREAIRRSSDAAESAVDAMEDWASVRSFAWAVDVAVIPPRRLTHQQFLARFADAEMQAILAAEAAQPAVSAWLEKFRLAGYVNLLDPATVAGVQALEIAGLLGSGRAAEVLA